jgi:uncharacterized protein (TIGR02466 family)
MSNKVVLLFGTPAFIPEKNYVPTNEEYNYILNLTKRPNEGGNLISENSYVLNEKPLENLKKYFEDQLNNYAHELLSIDEKSKFYITQSWCNYNQTKTYHHKHWHKNSIFTGVYYFNVEDCPIFFWRDGITELFPNYDFTFKQNNAWNGNYQFIDVEKNKLYLFPSSLPHSVQENKTNTLRISLSFNTFVKGEIGNENDLTSLKL